MIRHENIFPQKWLDLLVLALLTMAAYVLSLEYRVNFLTATFLFWGVPSLYLLWRNPEHLKKATIAAVILGVVWGFALHYVGELNHAWYWSSNTRLTFPISFGVLSLDILIWYFLWVFFIALFYRHFVDQESQRISKHAMPLLLGGVLAVLLLITLSKLVPQILEIPYAYLFLSALTLALCALIIWRHPKLSQKVAVIVPFFSLSFVAFEIVAMRLDLWGFPGEYIGSVSLLNVHFPLEEMLVWVIASSAVVASYYEFVVDDTR